MLVRYRKMPDLHYYITAHTPDAHVAKIACCIRDYYCYVRRPISDGGGWGSNAYPKAVGRALATVLQHYGTICVFVRTIGLHDFEIETRIYTGHADDDSAPPSRNVDVYRNDTETLDVGGTLLTAEQSFTDVRFPRHWHSVIITNDYCDDEHDCPLTPEELFHVLLTFQEQHAATGRWPLEAPTELNVKNFMLRKFPAARNESEDSDA